MQDQTLRNTHKTTGVCLAIAALVALGTYACTEVNIDPDLGVGGSGPSLGGSAGSAGASNGGASGSGGNAGSGGDGGSSGSGGTGSDVGGSGPGTGGSSAGTGGSSGSGPEPDPDAGIGDGGFDATLPDGAPIPPQDLISNRDFELGLSPWTAAFGGNLTISTTDAHGGLQCARVTGRTADYQGAHYDLTDEVTPGRSYDVSAFVRIGNASNATVKITARAQCAGSASHQYLPVRTLSVTNSAWSDLSGGKLNVPACDLIELLLYVEGPPAGVDIYVDDVSVLPS